MSDWTALPVLGKVRHIHFVGIGGAGMSGLAEVLKNMGYEVSGSDIRQNEMTQRLSSLGIRVFIGHSAAHIQNADVAVTTSAIAPDNEEVVAARQNRIPLVRRAEMLAEIMRFGQGIAIAGTHGKTTTTSLAVSILIESGLDPTYIIGGLLNSSGAHASLGRGNYIVAEADESDASFLHLQPVIAVITNIDVDHLDNYQGDFANLRRHFIEFLHQLPFYGLAILCVDDSGVQRILPDITKPIITYGMDATADYSATFIRQEGAKTWFNIAYRHNQNWLEIELNLPGRHNLTNALAAVAVAHQLGAKDENIVRALKKFQGISRRCHVCGDISINRATVTLIDDYAHHPTEIQATLAALRAGWPDRRLVVIYQPHRYTRTRDLFEDFIRVLSKVDYLLLLDVYSAGEEAITGADGRSLCRAIRVRGQVDPVFMEDMDVAFDVVPSVIEHDDVLLTLGAGSIGSLAKAFCQKYANTVH